MALEFPIELEFRNVDFFEEGGKPENPENPEKNPRSSGENQQQTQPTYDAGSESAYKYYSLIAAHLQVLEFDSTPFLATSVNTFNKIPYFLAFLSSLSDDA